MAAANTGQPLITVVTATYNRSNVLRHTIRSVLRSSISNFEYLVVGDHCTDDTAQVVASFDDPRLRFINLEENWGDQSGPNNVGARQARGRYIAYVNHDDLWFPDHLSSCIETIESTGADLVFSPIALATPGSAEDVEAGRVGFGMNGAAAEGRYEPYVFAPASGWLLQRELVDRVGDWRKATEVRTEASQDFLFRAWRSGAKMVSTRRATVLAIQSGIRPGVYAKREEMENAYYDEQIANDPTFRERVAMSIAVSLAGRLVLPGRTISYPQMVYRLLYRPLIWLGLNPRAVSYSYRFGGKGALIRDLRRRRGLPAS